MNAGRPAARGFTLLELMVAVAVVGLLLAVAYPSYMQQIAKSRRTEAKSVLLACAQMLERHNSQSGSYAAGTDAGVTAACLGTTRNGHYSLPEGNVPATAAAQTFLIRATPIGAQAGDACGTFAYAQDGTKSVSGASLPGTSCW